ncbi:MAG: hypothetical protein H6R00_2420 [Proteobacteria bacterium]|nr:hypothetical protein [Pseudomonadota bacterium]
MSFPDRVSWEAWLADHGAGSPGVWLKFAKKASAAATIAKPEAIEVALCFGWIDGQLDGFDDTFWLVRFTPRGPKSKWSQINRDMATRLNGQGRMTPAGHAEVEKAKCDGRWDAAYASQSKAEIPDDFQAALDLNPEAKAFFSTLKGANRYAILYRIHDAKTEKTRSARIEKFISMLALGQTIHPQKD